MMWHAQGVAARISRSEVRYLLRGFMRDGKNVRIVFMTLTGMNTMRGAKILTYEVGSMMLTVIEGDRVKKGN